MRSTFRILTWPKPVAAPAATLRLGAAALLLVSPALPCAAASARNSPRRVWLVLCDALQLQDLTNPRYPSLYGLAHAGAIGVMNCAVAGPRTPTAAVLTLAAGRQVPAEPADEGAANGWESVPGDHGTASEVFARRTGSPARPAGSVFHLGIAVLAQRGLASSRLGAALASACPPVRAAVFGTADARERGRRAALLTVDSSGKCAGRFLPGASGAQDDPPALAHLALASNARVVVVQLGDTARVEAMRSALLPAAYRTARARALERADRAVGLLLGALPAGADFVLVSPYPPSGDAQRSGAWGTLPPIAATGPDFAAGLLTSATTRTLGLVANVDLAPTLLYAFGVPAPAEMVGRPMQSSARGLGPGERLRRLTSMADLAALNGRAVIPIMIPLGGLCFLGVLTVLLARRLAGPAAARRLRPILLFTQSLPAATLVAPLLAPKTVAQYGAELAVCMAGLAAVAYGLAALIRSTPQLAAAVICLAIAAGDTLTGQSLVKSSILSGYALAGIRFYGVGNEFAGVLIGFVLAAAPAWLDDLRAPFPPLGSARIPRGVIAAVCAGLSLTLGLPMLGANAGSLVITFVGFGLLFRTLLGKRVTVWAALNCALLGLLAAVVLALADSLTGPASSHLGGAVQAATGGLGAGYLAEIAARKVAMNLRLLQSPWFLLPAAAVLLTLLGAWMLIRPELRRFPATRPWTVASVPAALAATIAALLFKDSGVVTVAFLVGAVCVVHLNYAAGIDAGGSGPDGRDAAPMC